MAEKKILCYPDPVLKKRSLPVSFDQPETELILQDMIDTLNSFPGCVGLAAPQIGFSARIIAIDCSRSSRVKEPHHGQIILINPEIISFEGERFGREGCLSIPDYTANVTRAQTIVVSGFTPDKKECSLTCTGFEAVVFQHEIDHLDGILFLDKVRSLKTDVFRRVKYLEKKG